MLPASAAQPNPTPSRLLVLVPLKHEWRALRLLQSDRLELVCCGPGQAGMVLAAGGRSGDWRGRSRPSAVVLAGLAGALDPAIRAGCAHWASAVIDGESGERFLPTFDPRAGHGDGRCPATDEGHRSTIEVLHDRHSSLRGGLQAGARPMGGGLIVVSSRSIVGTIDAKRRMHERTGAQLVDLESAAFARAANELGIPWAVIRGVSDDAHTPLPPGVGGWVDRDGGTRFTAVVASLLRHPGLVPRVMRLGRESRRAMIEVRRLLAQLN